MSGLSLSSKTPRARDFILQKYECLSRHKHYHDMMKCLHCMRVTVLRCCHVLIKLQLTSVVQKVLFFLQASYFGVSIPSSQPHLSLRVDQCVEGALHDL